jgi:hypothetical protein
MDSQYWFESYALVVIPIENALSDKKPLFGNGMFDYFSTKILTIKG